MKPGWVRTYTGRYVSVVAPKPEMFDPVDIAHHLSLECRWGGATKRHFSVAEHSLWVAKFVLELVPRDYVTQAVVHALLHDAHEAYLKDLPTPIKVLFPDYAVLASNLDLIIWKRFGIQPPSNGIDNAIKMADKYSVWCEAESLLNHAPGVKHNGVKPPLGLLEKVPMHTEIKKFEGNAEEAFLTYLNFCVSSL